MENKKTWRNLTILMVCLFLLLISINKLAYISSSSACGTFFRLGETRGAKYLHYEFFIDNVKHEGSISRIDLRIKSLDSLKKIDCIQIEYSNFSTYFNLVVDKRILK
jgi:hypothetical protein